MTELRLSTLILAFVLAALNWPALAQNAATLDAEQQLANELSRLELLADTPQRRAWLSELLDYQEHGRKPHPEHPSLNLPRHALSARAAQLLQHWDEQTAYERLLKNPFATQGKSSDPVWQAARIRWLAQASAAQLQRFRQNNPLEQLPEALLLALAKAQEHHETEMQLAKRGRERRSLQHLRARLMQAPEPATEHARLLAALRLNPAFAGAVAHVRLSQLQNNPQARQDFEQTWTGQPWNQELVELALQIQPQNLLATLQSRLLDADQAALACWGLWRLNSPEARRLLADYARADGTPRHLAEEVRGWLQ